MADSVRNLDTLPWLEMALSPDRVLRHFHLNPVRNLVRVEADRGSHTEKGNVIVLDLFVESSDANAQEFRQFFDSQGLLLGPQLFGKGRFAECLQRGGSIKGSAQTGTQPHRYLLI